MIETTITTTELTALAEAFDGWTWSEGSMEPDARVEVLIEEPASETRFLVRHQHGWLWATDANNAVARSKGQTTVSWNYAVDGVDAELRIPTVDELRAGGWTIEETPENEDEEETLPLATSALLDARDLLQREDSRRPLDREVNEATALALTSIAATLHDLSVLLEDEFAWRRSQRPVQGTDTEEDAGEDDSAHRSLGPGEDPGFSFSGR